VHQTFFDFGFLVTIPAILPDAVSLALLFGLFVTTPAILPDDLGAHFAMMLTPRM